MPRTPLAAATAAALGIALGLGVGAPAAEAQTRDRGTSAGDRPAYEYDGPANPNRQGRPPRGVSQREHDRGGQGDVNAAFMGGGVILEGAPGAPAPTPRPFAPGERPSNMVEPGTPLRTGAASSGAVGMGGGSSMSGTGVVGGPSTMDRPGMGPNNATMDRTGSAPVLTPGTGPNTMAPGMGAQGGMGVMR